MQAGIRWRDIQDYIDSHNLSLKIMQTYANFTVGGSLSVNVHGRYIGLWLREYVVDPIIYASSPVVWRNYEASYDVRELEPSSRISTTYALREYFVPVEKFDEYVPRMRAILQAYDVTVINVSVRHAHQDPGTLLAWAKTEVFAFVIYYRQDTSSEAQKVVEQWTRAMNDAAIELGGTYYLPYQVHETPAQFLAAYPRAKEFFAVKKVVDPLYRFRNQLWAKVYAENNAVLVKD